MNCLWTLPAGDADFALRWQVIEFTFSRCLPKHENRSPALAARRERGIWQRRHWELLIRDAQDYLRHFDYIHFDPVRHAHVTQVSDWPYFELSPGRARRDLSQRLEWW